MSKPTQAVQTRGPQPVAKAPVTISTCLLSPKWKEEVSKVIPEGIVIDAMLRVARTVASSEKFAQANPTSFLQALLKCARAGLYPDGREAHLIVFGKDVQAIFDVKGITALAARAGILVTPKLVYANDVFSVEEDDGTGKTRIIHKVDFRRDRGEIALAYSRAVLPSGQVDYEFMTSDEVEQTRKVYSRAKDSTPWKESWGEMAKKTVIKRHSKRWDMSPEIRQAMNDDDDSLSTQPEIKPISKPIFQPAVIEGSKPEEPATETRSTEDPRGHLVKLMMDAGVNEEQLMVFLRDVALAEDDDECLEDMDDRSVEAAIEQWDTLLVKLKATSE